ncbi:MAG: N-acetylmuramoyl-L-alanine amidase [Victivallales bacterium]|nr:N-acetylmuramoyl-L-alanine amidase [Victivallales bacterium]
MYRLFFICSVLMLWNLHATAILLSSSDEVYVPEPEYRDSGSDITADGLPDYAATTTSYRSKTPRNQRGVRFISYKGKRYVYLRDVAAYYGMQMIANPKNCGMIGKKFKLFMYFDKSYATLNDTVIHLFYPPLNQNGTPMISETDFLRQIDPIFRNSALVRHYIRTIVIDPGHGGNDEGARGRIYREKDLALEMGLKLRDALEKMGYKVVMTRTDDRTVSLEQRTRLAASVKADIFISIHCNKAADRSVSGLETFAMPAIGAPSTYGSSNNRRTSGNRRDNNNTRLGFEIQHAVKNATRANDRGLKRSRFFVLRNVSCPAVLIETGFLSNRAEEHRLGIDSYQDKITSAIVSAIFKYHRAMINK